MAHRATYVWKRSRRRLLTSVKKHLLQLKADRDREIVKEEAGKVPLYLAAPGTVTWDKVDALLTTIGAALSAKA